MHTYNQEKNVSTLLVIGLGILCAAMMSILVTSKEDGQVKEDIC